jgi:predicted RNase H-like HicB family nuclease
MEKKRKVKRIVVKPHHQILFNVSQTLMSVIESARLAEEAAKHARHAVDSLNRALEKDSIRAEIQDRYISAVKEYLVVFEKADNNYSAYIPDLPGCIATGKTLKETEKRIKEAISFHLEGLKEDGLPLPEPASFTEYVEV